MAFCRLYNQLGRHLGLLRHIPPASRHVSDNFKPFWSVVRPRSFASFDDQHIALNPSKRVSQRITVPVTDRNWGGKHSTGYKSQDRKGVMKRKGDRHKGSGMKDKSDNEILQKTNITGQVLYGKFPILIALQAKRRQFHKLYIKSSLLETQEEDSGKTIHSIRTLAKEQMIPIEPVSQQFLNRLVDDPMQGLRQHQGICADVSPLSYVPLDVDNISSVLGDTSGPPKVWLVVQSVQDPNNFGAVMRSAYYLGVDQVVAHNSCKLSPAVSKVSAGAIEVIEVYNTNNLQDLLQVFKNSNWQILGTTGSAALNRVIPLHTVTVDKNTMVLLGNEGQGLSEDICALCDALITIQPRHHHMEKHALLDSLNVSVASGIIMHHLLSSRSTS